MDISSHTFIQPERQVKAPMDMKKWLNSQAHNELVQFITAVSTSVKGCKVSDEISCSEVVTAFIGYFDTISKWADEIPPVEQPQRFGNRSFRDWLNRVHQNANNMLLEILGEKFGQSIPEIVVYLRDSFGNITRIDYGTGHELAFIAFLYCLCRIGALQQTDSCAIGLRLFPRYLELMRKLQLLYRMEPAGSQGVWSLDDFQFVPFIWGSAQFIGHQTLEPNCFVRPEVYNELAADYLFMSCIQFINKVKTGVFAEHSNQLWNISGVHTWEKVNSGLLKMYKAEVLSKFPIIQHFLFGSLLRIEPAAKTTSDLATWLTLFMDSDGLPLVGPVADTSQVEPIQQKRLLAFINHFIIHTASFLNKFSSSCEQRLEVISNRLNRLDINLSILESKLSSVPGLDTAVSAGDASGGQIANDESASASLQQQHQGPNTGTPATIPAEAPQTTPGASAAEEKLPAATDGLPAEPEVTQTPISKDPRFARYFKMLHVGVHPMAIKQKMMAEGVDPALLDDENAPAPPPDAANSDSDQSGFGSDSDDDSFH